MAAITSRHPHNLILGTSMTIKSRKKLIEVALPLADGLLPVPAGVFAALSALTTAGAFVARLLAQKD